MVFLFITCIVLSSIALHGFALHGIAWHCMVLQRLHGVVQINWRAGELPRSASSHFSIVCICFFSLSETFVRYDLNKDIFTINSALVNC